MKNQSNEQVLLKTLIEQKHKETQFEGGVSEYFELFSAEQVLKNFDLSYEELQRGITDGGDDGKIDSIYTMVDGELIEDDLKVTAKRNATIELCIIQSKFVHGFSEDVVTVLGTNLCKLLQLSTDLNSLGKEFSKDVLRKIHIFRETYKQLIARFPIIKIAVHYCTYAHDVHPKVDKKAEWLKSSLRSLFSDAKIEFHFNGAKRLLELARSAPLTSFQLELVENPITTTKGGYVCLCSLSAYRRFITDEAGALRREFFEANVRDFQGDVPVNEEIAHSLSSPGDEDFWWLNNGVTIICSKVSYAGKVLTIEAPEIVNGLQTSTVIFTAGTSKARESDQRNLLVRVVKPEREESRDKIIKATNSQTRMPPSSLRATDPIHRNIEEYLKVCGFFYDRRKNFYKNQGKAPLKIISIPFLAQCVMAIALKRPNDARARPSSVLNMDADYQEIFSQNHELNSYASAVRLVRRTERFLLEKSTEIDYGDRNNLKFYLAMLAALKICGKDSIGMAELATITAESIESVDLEDDYRRLKRIYDKLGSSDSAAKGKELLAELLRKKTSC
jgi:hypothetical protein